MLALMVDAEGQVGAVRGEQRLRGSGSGDVGEGFEQQKRGRGYGLDA